jgi:hypothetical protein
MANHSADSAHLRELAEKCRRAATSLIDETHVASLRQMAAEYEAMAKRIEDPPMPNPQLPFSQ